MICHRLRSTMPTTRPRTRRLYVNSIDGVRANDIDTDNTPYINPLTVQLVSGPANGTLSLDSSGLFTYTPNADFHGIDTFRLPRL